MHFMMKSREEGVRGRERREDGVGGGRKGEREACGLSKFLIPRTSRDNLVEL